MNPMLNIPSSSHAQGSRRYSKVYEPSNLTATVIWVLIVVLVPTWGLQLIRINVSCAPGRVYWTAGNSVLKHPSRSVQKRPQSKLQRRVSLASTRSTCVDSSDNHPSNPAVATTWMGTTKSASQPPTMAKRAAVAVVADCPTPPPRRRRAAAAPHPPPPLQL